MSLFDNEVFWTQISQESNNELPDVDTSSMRRHLDCPVTEFLMPFKNARPLHFNTMRRRERDKIMEGNLVTGDFFERMDMNPRNAFNTLWYTQCNLQNDNPNNLRKAPGFDEMRKQPGTVCLLSMQPRNLNDKILKKFRDGSPIMRAGEAPKRVYALVRESDLYSIYDSLSRGDRFFQEIYFTDTPHHFYLDIEKDLNKDHDFVVDSARVINDLRQQLDKVFIPVLLKFLNDHMGVPTRREDILVTDSSRAGIKFSVHIVVANGMYFKNTKDSLGFAFCMFVYMHLEAFGPAAGYDASTKNPFREFYSFVDKSKPNLDSRRRLVPLPNVKSVVDYSVYGKKTQNMRMVGAAKLDSLMTHNEDYRIHMRVLLPYKNALRPARDYFVTVLHPEDEQEIEMDERREKLIEQAEKARRRIEKGFGKYTHLMNSISKKRRRSHTDGTETNVQVNIDDNDEEVDNHFIGGMSRLMTDTTIRRCQILSSHFKEESENRRWQVELFDRYRAKAAEVFKRVIEVVHPDGGTVTIETHSSSDGYQLFTAKMPRTCNSFRKSDGSVGQLCYFNCTHGTHMALMEMLVDMSVGYFCHACSGKAIIFESPLPVFELSDAVKKFIFDVDPKYQVSNAFLKDMEVVKLNTPTDQVSELLPEIRENEEDIVVRYPPEEQFMREIYVPPDFKRNRDVRQTYILHGKMGSGKSTVITELIDNAKEVLGEDKCKIMAVSFRTVLANKAASEMGLTIYTTKDIWLHGKIAIQMDSIHKTIYDLVDANGSVNSALCTVYDVVIIDETCSLLSHLCSSTLEKKLGLCFKVLERIIQRSRVVVFADADFGIREQYFVRECRGVENLKYHFNPLMSIKSKYIEYCGEYEFVESLIAQLLHGGRVFYASNIKKRLEVHKKYIEDRFIYMYYFNKYFAICKLANDSGLNTGIVPAEADFDTLEKSAKDYVEFMKSLDDEVRYNSFEALLEVYLSEIPFHDVVARIVRCIRWNRDNPDYFFGGPDADERIFVISGTSNPSQKAKWTENTKLWETCALLMVTPTVGAGVDYNGEHFNSVFIYAGDGSCSARAVHQMRGRCRNLKNQTCHVYITSPKEDFHEMNEDELHKSYPHSIQTCEQENLRNLIQSNDAELVDVEAEDGEDEGISKFVRKRGILGVLMDYNMLETNLSIINFRKCFIELAVRDNPDTQYYLSNKFDMDRNFWFHVVCEQITESVKSMTIDAIASAEALGGEVRKEFLAQNRRANVVSELDNLLLDHISSTRFIVDEEGTAEAIENKKRKNEILAFFDLRGDIPQPVWKGFFQRIRANDHHGTKLQQIDLCLFFMLGEQRVRDICIANKKALTITTLEDSSKMHIAQNDAPEYYFNLFLKFQLMKYALLVGGAPFGDMSLDPFEWFVTHKRIRDELELDQERKQELQTWIVDNLSNYKKFGIRSAPVDLSEKAWEYKSLYRFVYDVLKNFVGVEFAKKKKRRNKRKRSSRETTYGSVDTGYLLPVGNDSDQDDFPMSQSSFVNTQNTQNEEEEEDDEMAAPVTYLAEDRTVLRRCELTHSDAEPRSKCQIRCMAQKEENLLAEMLYARLTAAECPINELSDREFLMQRLHKQLSHESHNPVSEDFHADFLGLLQPRENPAFMYPIEGLILEQQREYQEKMVVPVDLDDFYMNKEYNVMHSTLESGASGGKKSVRNRATSKETGSQEWNMVVKTMERRVDEWKRVHEYYGVGDDENVVGLSWMLKIFANGSIHINETAFKQQLVGLKTTRERNIAKILQTIS